MTALGCQRLLWLRLYDPVPDEDQGLSVHQKAGILVGEKARLLFERGVLVDQQPWEHAEAVLQTTKLLANRKVPVIFEGGFEFDNVRVRADVLERLPRNRWGLYEVKSSNKVKAEHYDDLAIQAYVLRGVGLKIDRVGVIHLNGDYKRGKSGINWARMFKSTDITDKVNEMAADVATTVSGFHRVLRKRKEPAVRPGLQCSKECEFLDRCTAEKPDDWIRWLPRISPKKFNDLETLGCDSVASIPDGFSLTHNQSLIRDVLASKQDHVSPDLVSGLRSLGPPTYYLDFEAMHPGVPLYPGTSPYQVIPFQWSLHKLDRNGNLRHWEFLADGRDDPRRECAETLIKAAGRSSQTILAYSSYELTTIRGLEAVFPDLGPELSAIASRIQDIKKRVSDYTYLKAYNFSQSIKSVAPALSPGFEYDDLDGIADGSAASEAFEAIVKGELTEGETEMDLRQALLRYCERDTLAMVEVHAGLRSLSYSPFIGQIQR
jgi:predicted RecB family nuclease